MRRVLFAILVPAIIGCGGDDGKAPLWVDNPECEGEAVVPFAGAHQIVINELDIADKQDGFDLDNDGEPDNAMSAVGAIAGDAVQDAVINQDILIPMEIFDLQAGAADECVKFAVYLGIYRLDADGDGAETADEGGDCNDGDMNIRPGVAEIDGNGVDDNCNGLADEDVNGMPSNNQDDADADGVSLADGDCDDTANSVGGTGAVEVCGDGLDNDCNGTADFDAACSPYDADTSDALRIDPLSFDASGAPVIIFDDGRLDAAGHLTAGPSIFSVNVPVTDDIALELRISGARIEADVMETAEGIAFKNARLGGVLDANTLDKIRGLEVEQISLRPEDSLLDAVFAGAVGLVIGLGKNDEGCLQPDIDVDQDGLEAFCDTILDDGFSLVDTCIDGDGTRYTDTVQGGVITQHCTEVLNDDGTPKFADGVSIALTFSTVPTTLAE